MWSLFSDGAASFSMPLSMGILLNPFHLALLRIQVGGFNAGSALDKSQRELKCRVFMCIKCRGNFFMIGIE